MAATPTATPTPNTVAAAAHRRAAARKEAEAAVEATARELRSLNCRLRDCGDPAVAKHLQAQRRAALARLRRNDWVLRG